LACLVLRQQQNVIDPEIVVSVHAAVRDDNASIRVDDELGGQSPNAAMNPLSAAPFRRLAAKACEGLPMEQRAR